MNAMSTHSFASIAVTVFLIAAAELVKAEDVTLQVGITGNNKLEGLQDPVTVAQMPEVSELLQAIADKPRNAAYIGQSLRGSGVDLASLVELDLLKPWNGGYAISFNYLTLEDHDLLVTTLAPFAESLAQSYRDRWAEFESVFSAYDIESVDTGELAYAVIGAMSLDWDGLDITADKDLRITANNLPGGRDFAIWAKEQSSERNVRELYWGSHNTVVDGIRFTTFGDHYSLPRLGLPDLLWSTSSRVAKIDGASRTLRISVYKALAPYYQDDFLRDAGAILSASREGGVTIDSIAESTAIDKDRAEAIFTLLMELQYVKRDKDSYVLAAPYFSFTDKPMTDAARELSWLLMDEWLDLNYSTVQARLELLTARKYGVPYRQLFTEIWHYLFGLTNRALVASGHFADPYAEERIGKGMIPFVFDADLLEFGTELSH
ncbi:MAG: hypothetical protein GTO71_07820 [Woeseiaceae bacterium]|nr:hypothetical protein [Woeseiaceae bacterium]NIP20995.1 hypothetical protein [Woeseiaceae bacterium]NIS89975.1 hypothetical protein [Woeseiaceae bacterium]